MNLWLFPDVMQSYFDRIRSFKWSIQFLKDESFVYMKSNPRDCHISQTYDRYRTTIAEIKLILRNPAHNSAMFLSGLLWLKENKTVW